MNTRRPSHPVCGNAYDLTELITEENLPKHIQLAWRNTNDWENLNNFLASNIRWAECDVRLAAMTNQLVLRHDPFDETALDDPQPLLSEFLSELNRHNRKVKLDFNEDSGSLELLSETIAVSGLDDSQLWFDANIETLGRGGFEKLAHEYPSAILQCPVDFLAPLILACARKAEGILDTFSDWGINRFSISWQTPQKRRILNKLEEWGFDSNIYDVPDLESFLQASSLQPRSITSDFYFPKWNYRRREAERNSDKRAETPRELVA